MDGFESKIFIDGTDMSRVNFIEGIIGPFGASIIV
jgi:hypothetical protein